MVQTLLGLALVFMAGYTLFSGREPEAVVLSADEQWRLEVSECSQCIHLGSTPHTRTSPFQDNPPHEKITTHCSRLFQVLALPQLMWAPH